MQLVETIKQVLETGVLSMTVERQMRQMLSQEFDADQVALIDQLIEALANGSIRAIA